MQMTPRTWLTTLRPARSSSVLPASASSTMVVRKPAPASSRTPSARATPTSPSRVGGTTDAGRRGLELSANPRELRNNNFSNNNISLVILTNDTLVVQNRFTGNQTAIVQIGNVTGLDIRGNFAHSGTDTMQGILLGGSVNHSLIRNNLFNFTTRAIFDDPTVTLDTEGPRVNLTIRNNTINLSATATAGMIRVIDVTNSIFAGNTLTAFGSSVFVLDINDSLIENNTLNRTSDIAAAQYGIQLIGGLHTNISRNIIQHDAGITVGPSVPNISMVNNTIFYSDFFGIQPFSADNNLTNNTIRKISGTGTLDLNLTT